MTKKQRHARMRKIVKSFQEYVATYDQQACYEDYEDRTFIADMLYGIGRAIDEVKHHGPYGFEAFAEVIRSCLPPATVRYLVGGPHDTAKSVTHTSKAVE